MNGSGRINNERFREQQSKKSYARALESRIGKWDKVSDVAQMWEEVKQDLAENSREVCYSVRVGRKISD